MGIIWNSAEETYARLRLISLEVSYDWWVLKLPLLLILLASLAIWMEGCTDTASQDIEGVQVTIRKDLTAMRILIPESEKGERFWFLERAEKMFRLVKAFQSQSLFSTIDGVVEFALVARLRDRYGNTSEDTVIVVSFRSADLERINFDNPNFVSSDLLELVHDTEYLHYVGADLVRSYCVEGEWERFAPFFCSSLEKPLHVPVKVTEQGETPLHVAARTGDVEAIRALLRNGVDLNARRDDGRSPLSGALWSGHTEIARMLLSVGTDPNAGDDVGEAPLHIAAKMGDEEATRALLRHGADPNAKEGDGQSPLHHATYSPEVARLLLSAGADPNARQLGDVSPLHVAAQAGKTQIVSMLLEAGADSNAQDDNGWTPLHYAARTAFIPGVIEAAQLLVAAGANVNARDSDGITPLEVAKRFKDQDDLALAEYLSGIGAE